MDIRDAEPGAYLLSDQGTAVESQILDRLTDVRDLLLGLTFSTTASGERTRETALLQCEALWRTIYYANGS